MAAMMGIAFLRLVLNPPTDIKAPKGSTTSTSSSGSIRGGDGGIHTTAPASEKWTMSPIEAANTTTAQNNAFEKGSFDKSQNSTAALATTIPNALPLKVPTSLKPYQASLSPVLGDYFSNDDLSFENFLVQVHLIVDISGDSGTSPASKSLLEAVERSQYLQLTATTFVKPDVGTIQVHPRRAQSHRSDQSSSNNEQPRILPLLYLIDFGSMDRDCHRLQLVLEHIQTQRDGLDNDDDEEPYMLLLDFTGSTRQTQCDFLLASRSSSSSSTSSRVRLAKRSIVQNRYFNFTSQQIHLGEVAPNTWQQSKGANLKPVLHSPFVLREGFAATLSNITAGNPVLEVDRPMDVGYFWKRGDYSHYGFFRREMAEVVKTLHHSKTSDNNVIMENQVQIAYSDEKGMEAGNIQYEYAFELLSCKIVVVTQRDEWEDHYRLMESLASGAMVLTDRMLAMPLGMEDRVNVVVYKDQKDLKDLIRHYLRHEEERKTIASAGYKLVMGRHRCWHRLEELLFGRPLTHVDRPFDSAPAKEARPANIYWLLDEESNATKVFV